MLTWLLTHYNKDSMWGLVSTQQKIKMFKKISKKKEEVGDQNATVHPGRRSSIGPTDSLVST